LPDDHFPESDCRPGGSVMMLSPMCAGSFRRGQRRDPARDEVEIILDRKIPPRFLDLSPNRLLLVRAPVMPEHGCSIVKAEMVSIAGRTQLQVVHALLIALRRL
jgi:hypothetical protein